MLIISTDRKPLSYRQYATMVRLYPDLIPGGEDYERFRTKNEKKHQQSNEQSDRQICNITIDR